MSKKSIKKTRDYLYQYKDKYIKEFESVDEGIRAFNCLDSLVENGDVLLDELVDDYGVVPAQDDHGSSEDESPSSKEQDQLIAMLEAAGIEGKTEPLDDGRSLITARDPQWEPGMEYCGFVFSSKGTLNSLVVNGKRIPTFRGKYVRDPESPIE